MEKKIELLAPGGDLKSMRAAIAAGADAIYCGLEKFNARNRATNISLTDLIDVTELAHKHTCEIFLTLNIIVADNEFPALYKLLNKIVNTKIDGIIIQDFALFSIIKKHFPSLAIHASTQLTTHNKGQIAFLKKLGSTRVNLSRELSLPEITELTQYSHSQNVLTEVFVHGSNCISFSGQCYMSSVHGGNSGNRGRCSQPCRDEYATTKQDKHFPLNIKDNSAITKLHEIAASGVDSIKVEGRIKGYEYVYTVINAWRQQLKKLNSKQTITYNKDLQLTFNRSYTTDFLDANISKEMFIDNPRDNSLIALEKAATNENERQEIRDSYFTQKINRESNIDRILEGFTTEKLHLNIDVSGSLNLPLKISVKSKTQTLTYYTESKLSKASEQQIIKANHIQTARLEKQFKAIDETEFNIQSINTNALEEHLFVPFAELNTVRNNIIHDFCGRDMLAELMPPKIAQHAIEHSTAKLSVLISNKEDIAIYNIDDVQLYFEIPQNISHCVEEYIKLFSKHKSLIPWFPNILMGKDYTAAVSLLNTVLPKEIISNNTGIAYEAFLLNIKWTAGPYLNIINSQSLLTLQEEFNCSGAFISNELSKMQLRGIKRPQDFDLHYSLLHPMVLMTSRQCLFHQVTGCYKSVMDNNCVSDCVKKASIKNLNNTEFFIQKTAHNLHTVYNEKHYLNTEVIRDFKHIFSNYMIDLRDVESHTAFSCSKAELALKFKGLLLDSTQSLEDVILDTTNTQYSKGI